LARSNDDDCVQSLLFIGVALPLVVKAVHISYDYYSSEPTAMSRHFSGAPYVSMNCLCRESSVWRIPL
jgi:hypothetical protein